MRAGGEMVRMSQVIDLSSAAIMDGVLSP